MHHKTDKSSLFNFDTSIIALVLWILSIIGLNPVGGLLLIIGCVIVLKFETQSSFLRNHVSQILALSIFSTAIGFLVQILTMVFAGALALGMVFIPVIFVLSWAAGIITFVFALLGAIKAFQKETFKLPLIGFIGETIESSIRPD